MINAGVIEQYWYVWEGGGKGGVKLIIMYKYSTCVLGAQRKLIVLMDQWLEK